MTVDNSRLSLRARKYDRPRVTVILSNGRVVQTREWLSHSRFVARNQNKNICAAQQSSEVQVIIMDYNQSFKGQS